MRGRIVQVGRTPGSAAGALAGLIGAVQTHAGCDQGVARGRGRPPYLLFAAVVILLLVCGTAAAQDERPADPAVWGKEFPLQYEMWKRPSRFESKWQENRGHAFSLKDRDESVPDGDPRWKVLMAGRPKMRPLPAGCLDCHASGPVRGSIYWEGRRTAKTPVACVRCHDARSVRLVPGGGAARTCAQCHVEYFIRGGIRRPDGAGAGAIEAYYNRIGYSDWTHAATGAAVIEPRHPQFEMYSQGLHARSAVACPDCHMPRVQAGNVLVRDHQMRSPLENLERACAGCHRLSGAELRERVKTIQERTAAAESRALDALVELIGAIRDARGAGVPDSKLSAARTFQRRAQWRVMFVHADRSGGFHAPGESVALLLEAIDYARRGRMTVSSSRK